MQRCRVRRRVLMPMPKVVCHILLVQSAHLSSILSRLLLLLLHGVHVQVDEASS